MKIHGRYTDPRLRLEAVIVLMLAIAAAGLVAGVSPGRSASPAGPQTAMGQLAASLQPGEWAELETLDINPVLSASGSSGMIFGYTDYIKWDPISERLLYVGGDHGDLPKFVTYSAATNTWQELPQEAWMQPTSHGYDHSGLNPATGEFFHRPFASRDVYRYDPSTSQWEALPSIPTDLMDYNNCCVGMDYFPEMSGLVYASIGNNNLIIWEESTNQWRALASGLTMGGYHHFAEYNPVHQVVVFGGGNAPGSRKIYRLDQSGQVSALADAPFDLGVQWGAVFTVDPVSGDYLVLRSNGEFHQYDVSTDKWSLISPSTPVTTTSYGNPIHGVVASPISTHGVTLFVTCDGPANCRVTLYKHAPAPPLDEALYLPVVLRASSLTPSPLPGGDFGSRCSGPEVVRCYGFNDPQDLAGRMYDPWGGPGLCTGGQCWQVDPGIAASGGGSLRFEIPSNSPADTSGSFWMNFADDLSVQFGENDEFFIQWRQRFSPEFLTTDYAGGGGWKQAIVGTGDQSGQPYYSCSDLEVVTVNGYHRGFAQMYNSCSGSSSHGPFDGFEEPFGAYDFKLQNGRPDPYCLYSQGQTSPPTYFPPEGNCFGYYAEEWMTFQINIQTGPRMSDEFVDSYVRMWIGREGQPSQLVVDWGPYNLTAGPPDEGQMFGKIWFLPYNTDKDSSQTHPVAYTWYDELIISRALIPDPQILAP